MPCSISQEEIELYEKEENEKLFDKRLTDARLLEEVACQACKYMQENGTLKDAPKFIQKWFKHHQKKDRKRKRG